MDEVTKPWAGSAAQKRTANTIAARKSRRRKVEFIEGLQTQLQDISVERDALQDENLELRKQIVQLQEYLQAQSQS